MFRSEKREALELRLKKGDIAPVSTKYTPNYAIIYKNTLKNVDFGYRGSLERAQELEERKIRIKEDLLCTKGASQCMNSIRRVKNLVS